MSLSEESRQKIHSYMEYHNQSSIHSVFSQISSVSICNGKTLYPTVKEGEYHVFAENAYGYSVYALYKYDENTYCIKSGLFSGEYVISRYCKIDSELAFDNYII